VKLYEIKHGNKIKQIIGTWC